MVAAKCRSPGVALPMIEMSLSLKNCHVAARFRGAVTNAEFADLAANIVNFGSTYRVLVYLDWARVDHWKFAPPTASGVTAWRKAAKVIERAAIIHDHHLNRQAAWLAAILRKEGVTVRSWRPQNAAAAAKWLGTNSRQPH